MIRPVSGFLELPLVIFLALTAASTAALVWWAVGEIFRGVNPWRRMLGAAALAIVVVGLVGRDDDVALVLTTVFCTALVGAIVYAPPWVPAREANKAEVFAA